MEARLKQVLCNFSKKSDLLKQNLVNFIEQTKLIENIEKIYEKSDEIEELSDNQCLSVLQDIDAILDRLNKMLTKEKLTKHIPSTKYFMCTLTCMLHAEKQLFYVLDNNNPIMTKILKLREIPTTLPCICKFPNEQQVFGYLFQQQVYRAMLEVGSKSIYLIDSGEKIAIKINEPFEFYELPKELQEIPMQAILCKLIGVLGRQSTKPEMRNMLKQLIGKKTAFLVERIKNEILHVLLIEKDDTENITIKQEKVEEEEKEKVLDEEEEENFKQLLYEEPLGTSNALKAVLGYVPKDESRLCAFYNPKTGGCFKGARCKLEHAAPSKDAFTSDIVPANVYNHNNVEIKYDAEQIINITVTYVNKLYGFYAKINENPNASSEEFIWQDNLITSRQRYHPNDQIPQVYDMVLARTDQGLWYRAQISSVLIPGAVFEVYFVDCGNIDAVELKNLAHCGRTASLPPFQVEFIYLADVHASRVSRTELLKGLNILNKALLYQTFDVRVVSHDIDLFVEFIDEKVAVVDELCALGFVKCIHKHN